MSSLPALDWCLSVPALPYSLRYLDLLLDSIASFCPTAHLFIKDTFNKTLVTQDFWLAIHPLATPNHHLVSVITVSQLIFVGWTYIPWLPGIPSSFRSGTELIGMPFTFSAKVLKQKRPQWSVLWLHGSDFLGGWYFLDCLTGLQGFCQPSMEFLFRNVYIVHI